jgi:hypothetical protein
MTSRLVSIWGAAALLTSSIAADAATITNRDEQDQKITIVEGDAKSEHTIRPGQVLENICVKGCIVRLSDSDEDEYEVAGEDVVSIEEGYLYYDGPDGAPNQGTAGPNPGQSAPAPQPKK